MWILALTLAAQAAEMRIWSVDAQAPGLDASSYHHGDGASGWSYPSDGVGTFGEGDAGLEAGTCAHRDDGGFKGLPSGEVSITTCCSAEESVKRLTGITPGCGLRVGSLDNTKAANDYYAVLWYSGVDGAPGQLQVVRFVNNSLVETITNITGSQEGGMCFRIGVSSDRTSTINFFAGPDGLGWLPIGTDVPNAVTLEHFGPWWTGDADGFYAPFLRARTGSGELTNQEPEGYPVIVDDGA